MLKFIKAVVVIFLGIVIIAGITGYFFVRNFDLNKYKSYASEIVENQLGRKLAINGNASLGISLIPTVIVEDVELANAPWAANPQMVKIQKLELKFALLPLLKKQIVIDKAILSAPQIYLETAKDGKNNWEFQTVKKTQPVAAASGGWLISEAQAQESKPAANAPDNMLTNLVAKNVVIENGAVQYNNKGQISNLTINTVRLAAPSVNDNISGSFDVVYNGDKIKGDLNVGSLSALFDGKKDYPVTLSAQAMGADINIDGAVTEVMTAPRFAFNTNLYNPAGNFGAPETTLTAYVSGNTQQVNADIKLLNIVNNKITGKVSADIAGKLPSVKADLTSDQINLQNFNTTSSPMAFEFPSLISEAQALSVVPATPVPYQLLKSLNADVNLKIGSLIINPAMSASNVLLNAKLLNGVLTVNPLQLQFGSGDIAAKMTVNANNHSAQLNLTSKDILLQQLHKEFVVSNNGDFGIVSGGKTDVEANLTTSGDTYRQLVQNLNGLAVVMVDQSVIKTGALKFLSGNVISQVLNVLQFNSKKVTELDLNCAVVRVDFAKGKAVFPKGIAFNAKQLNLVSDGKINLVNDAIDFTVHPYSGKVVDSNIAQALSSFIKVKGTINDPKVTLDDKQALKAIVGVATAGPAYLGSKLVVDADSTPCYTALQGTPYQNRYPGPSKTEQAGQDVYQGAAQGVDDGIKAVKDTAKELINIFKKPKGTN